MFTIAFFTCYAKTNHLDLWRQVTTQDVPFKTLVYYLKTHPKWPDENQVIAKAETYIKCTTRSDIALKWFEKYPPQNLETYHIYIFHLLKEDKFEKAKSIVKEIWQSNKLDAEQQHRWINKYGYLLDESDHIKRLNFLLYNEYADTAHKLLKYITNKRARANAELRICLIKNQPKLKLPEKYSVGVLYQYIKYLRKNEKYEEAAKLLAAKGLDDSNFQKQWSLERQIVARNLLEKKQYKTAYQILKKFPFKNSDDGRDILMLKTWIGIEFLGLKQSVINSLKEVYTTASHHNSKAFAAYHLGIVYQKLNRPKESQIWFVRASKRPASFYGLLARDLITKRPIKLTYTVKNINLNRNPLIQTLFTLKPQKDKDIIDKFVVRAAYMTQSLDSSVALLNRIAKNFTPYHTLLAAMHIKKRFHALPMQPYLYPAINIDTKDTKSKSMILGLIRQESLFNPNAVSCVGALGYMQLMPETAKIIARKVGGKIRNRNDILKAQNNLKWGSYHIQYLSKDYFQSLPLALAAYNAGEHRVNQWLKTYGDPRKNEISMMRWIHLIPFKETRLYVMYVLAHMQIYMHMFGAKNSIKTLLK